MSELGPVEPTLRSANEPLTLVGAPTGFTLGEFWAWNGSDLLNNAFRGKLAEFIVSRAVGAAASVRAEWDAYDVLTPYGARIEVKSAAYVQSWHQERLSTIGFGIARRFAWDPESNKFGDEQVRSADLYVFCLLHHRDQATIDPLAEPVNDFETPTAYIY